MKFGEQLRAARVAAGLTQVELAETAGVSISALHDYEQSRRLPGLPALAWLCRALKVSADTFMDCDDVKPEKPQAKRRK